MNKATIVKVCSAVLQVCAIVTGMAAYGELIPGKYKAIAATGFAVATAVSHFAEEIEDALEGKPLPPPVVAGGGVGIGNTDPNK